MMFERSRFQRPFVVGRETSDPGLGLGLSAVSEEEETAAVSMSGHLQADADLDGVGNAPDHWNRHGRR